MKQVLEQPNFNDNIKISSTKQCHYFTLFLRCE